MQYVCMHSTVCMHSIGFTLEDLVSAVYLYSIGLTLVRIDAWGIRPPRGVPGLGYVCG